MAFDIRSSGFEMRDSVRVELAQVVGTRTGKTFISGTLEDCRKWVKNRRANYLRKAKDEAMRSIGMVKVRGANGGTYWE